MILASIPDKEAKESLEKKAKKATPKENNFFIHHSNTLNVSLSKNNAISQALQNRITKSVQRPRGVNGNCLI